LVQGDVESGRRYRCVDAQKAAGFAVAAGCQAAGVTRSAYYAWAARTAQGPAERHWEEAELVSEIRRIHTRSRGTYGAPPIHTHLRGGGRASPANQARGERLCAAPVFAASRPRRRRSLTKQAATAAPAPDLLGRL